MDLPSAEHESRHSNQLDISGNDIDSVTAAFCLYKTRVASVVPVVIVTQTLVVTGYQKSVR
jgi:hypothetical protein